MRPSRRREHIRLNLALAGPNFCSRLGSWPPVDIVYGMKGLVLGDWHSQNAYTGSDCLYYTVSYVGRAIPVSHEGVTMWAAMWDRRQNKRTSPWLCCIVHRPNPSLPGEGVMGPRIGIAIIVTTWAPLRVSAPPHEHGRI